MNAMELRSVTKAYPSFKLDGLTLNVPAGCILGLIGENGAGKSTTIKCMLDMIRPDSGAIEILGQSHRTVNKEDLGVVLDEVGLPGALNARQIGKTMAGIYRQWEPDTYAAYLKRLNIPENKIFGKFSKGMKMKLGLAVALSHGAKVLILDEATAGLDPVVRDEFLDIFNDFTRDEGRAVLISSHIVSDLEKICDYIAFLHQGKLMLCQEKDQLLEQYAFVHGTARQLDALDPDAVIGRKDGRFGSEAIVLRSAVGTGFQVSPVSIEELFVFMVKEERE